MFKIFKETKKENPTLIKKEIVGLNELISSLESTFPQIEIHPDVPYEKVLYNAGERAVIKWLKRQAEKGR
jgi:hypothetical protein